MRVRTVVALSYAVSVGLLVVFLTWGDARYLAAQASYVVGDLLGAKQFSRVPDPTPQERELFSRVATISRFGFEALGLEDTAAFSRYKWIDREALVWVVSGVRQFAWQRYQWGYPFLGGLPYRGYYREADAAREAAYGIESSEYKQMIATRVDHETFRLVMIDLHEKLVAL